MLGSFLLCAVIAGKGDPVVVKEDEEVIHANDRLILFVFPQFIG